MALHEERHPRAGQTVKLRPGVMLRDFQRDQWVDGSRLTLRLEDWADRLLHQSWLDTDLGNPVVHNYAKRAAERGLPMDDDVVGLKDLRSHLSHLVHVSELAE